MKKLFILGLVLLMVVVFGTAALAKAEKVDLILCNYYTPGVETPSGGFVIFNNSSGTEHNLELTVSLKGVKADTEYDIYLGYANWTVVELVGTVKTNASGNANLHINVLLESGDLLLNIDVTLKGSGADVFETPGIHTGGGTWMTFK